MFDTPELMDIRRMYQRFVATPRDASFPPPFESDTNPPFNKGSQSFYQNPKDYYFRKPHDETEQCIIFVHGWDVNEESFIWLSALNMRRLWHMGYKGRFAAFQWDTYSSDNTSNFTIGHASVSKMTFNRSEYRASKYGRSLALVIQHLKNEFPHVDITAHSMGNIVTLSALDYDLPGATVRNYVLQNSAASASMVDTNPDLMYIVNHNTKDMYRGYSELLLSLNRGSRFINFFLETDEATNFWWRENNKLNKPNHFAS